jgi:hypothetical protein
MNEKKLKQLFAAARQEPAPAPPADFAADVLRAARQGPARQPEAFSVWDHLDGLFPRLALAAAAVIVFCAAADWGITAAGYPGINEAAAQATSQILFSGDDL